MEDKETPQDGESSRFTWDDDSQLEIVKPGTARARELDEHLEKSREAQRVDKETESREEDSIVWPPKATDEDDPGRDARFINRHRSPAEQEQRRAEQLRAWEGFTSVSPEEQAKRVAAALEILQPRKRRSPEDQPDEPE